jgi:hypothetical protein
MACADRIFRKKGIVMPPLLKATIGLLLALLAAWASHGPLGRGETLVDRLESEARAAVAEEDLPGISVRLDRRPLARSAVLSGPANDFQRNGMGSAPGLTGKVEAVEGIGGVRWADQPVRSRGTLPLLAETMILAALAYLIGLGLGWLLWGRPRREGFA